MTTVIEKTEKVVHTIDEDGLEILKEYDNNKNLIHYKDSFGGEFFKDYDENGKLIHSKKIFEKWYNKEEK